MTGIELKTNSEIDLYLFIEKGLRGGISYICNKYSEANNTYVKNYDPTKPSKFILDLDMNNLYGWGMSKFLPYRGFKQIKNVDNFDVDSISEKHTTGNFPKVCLEYPDELHNLHNNHPLAPEKLAIPYDMLSDYCKNITDKYGIKVGDVKKLIPNLDDKKLIMQFITEIFSCIYHWE